MVMFWGDGFSSPHHLKSGRGCVTSLPEHFSSETPRAHAVAAFGGLKMQSVMWSQIRCSLIHTASWSGTWRDLSPKGTYLDLALEETAWLAVKASWESVGACVDVWGLESEIQLAREVKAEQGIPRESSAGMFYMKDKGGGTYNLKIMNFNSLFTPASCFECL